MSTEAKTLKGFRDIMPADALAKERMLDIVKKVFQSFGFVPIETPHLEYLSCLNSQGGEEISKEIYHFKDSGGRDVALRFDQTVPLARFISQHENELQLPFKRYAIGNVFRGENPQAGRYREFTQCDFDFIGADSILSDFEIIQVICSSMKALGINDFTVAINSRKILNAFLSYIGVDGVETVLRIVDKLAKIGSEKVLSLLVDEGISESNSRKILEFVSVRSNGLNSEFLQILDTYASLTEQLSESISELKEIIKLANVSEVCVGKIEVDFSIARGLAYYTGVVYETTLNNLPSIGSVCSGGRYDDLTKSFGKENLSGVGASIGIDRLIAGLEKLGLSSSASTAVNLMVANIDEDLMSEVSMLADSLRSNGISVELYPTVTKLKKQLGFAHKKQIPYVAILGQDELSNGIVALKNMSTGDQENLPVAEVIKKVK